MTESGLAQLIIPIAGTLFLTAWLALVFHADRRPWPAGGNAAPGHESPGPAALDAPPELSAVPAIRAARASGHVIQVPAPAQAQEDLLAASMDGANLRVIFEVER